MTTGCAAAALSQAVLSSDTTASLAALESLVGRAQEAGAAAVTGVHTDAAAEAAEAERAENARVRLSAVQAALRSAAESIRACRSLAAAMTPLTITPLFY